MEPRVRIADDDLVARASRGDEKAFCEIYDRYKTALLGFCLSLLRKPEDAEDALQETFRYFFSRLGTYAAAGKLRAYLYRLAHSFCIDALRRRRRAALPLEPEYEPAGLAGPARELVDHARRCIEQLADPYRAVVTLRVAHEFTYDEIAEIMGCPIGTVKSRIHNAMEILRHCVGAERLLEE